MKTLFTAYLLLGASILAVPNSDVFLRRLTDRLDSFENRLTSDTRNLRDDILLLFDQVQRIERWTNQSVEYLPALNNRDTDDRQDSDGLKDLVSKVKTDLQILKRGFREEKQLNSRARRSTWAVSALSEEITKHFTDFSEKLNRLNSSLAEEIETLKAYLRDALSKLEENSLPESCLDLHNQGYTASGVYKIRPAHMYEIDVYCDMDTADGGWLVLQRREDGSVDFYRNWKDYKNGFGDMRSEFWLGNEILHHLTGQSTWQLRVDLKDFEGNSRYAEYSRFSMAPETDGYRISVGSFSGNANDSLSSHNNLKFVTKDKNDVNRCSKNYRGGWWYGNCHSSNLNGLYLAGNTTIYAKGVVWYAWKRHYYSLKTSEMKLRPI